MTDRRKTAGLAAVWGIITLVAYGLVFANQAAVLDYTTRGGFFAVLVVAMALVFSFIHGAFANYLLEAIGIRPLKQKGGK